VPGLEAGSKVVAFEEYALVWQSDVEEAIDEASLWLDFSQQSLGRLASHAPHHLDPASWSV
jgi:hypothetical protein